MEFHVVQRHSFIFLFSLLQILFHSFIFVCDKWNLFSNRFIMIDLMLRRRPTLSESRSGALWPGMNVKSV